MHTKKAMQWSLSVLMQLSPNDTHRTKYIRTLSLALCLWTPWSDITQGCIHVEESCEAMLSTVTRGMRAHGCRTGHEHYLEVYLTTPVAKTDMRRRSGIPKKVLDRMGQRLTDLESVNMCPPEVMWSSGKTTTANSYMNKIVDRTTVPIISQLGRREVETELHCTLYTLVTQGTCAAELKQREHGRQVCSKVPREQGGGQGRK